MARGRQMSPRGTGVFLLIFGVVWLFAGIMAGKQYNANEAKKKVCTQSISATVTNVDKRVETRRSKKRTTHRTVYYADYEYEVSGNRYSGEYKYQSAVSVGESVSIFYNPDDPAEHITSAALNGQGGLKAISIVLRVIGGIIGVVGLYGLITGKRIGSSR